MGKYITMRLLKWLLILFCIILIFAMVNTIRMSRYALTENCLQLPDIDECQISIMEFLGSGIGYNRIEVTEKSTKQILYNFAKSLRYTRPEIPYEVEGVGHVYSYNNYVIEFRNTECWIGFNLQGFLLQMIGRDGYEKAHFGQPHFVVKFTKENNIYTSHRMGLYKTSDEELYNAASSIVRTTEDVYVD